MIDKIMLSSQNVPIQQSIETSAWCVSKKNPIIYNPICQLSIVHPKWDYNTTHNSWYNNPSTMFHGKPIKYHPRFMVKSPECQNFLETSSEGVQASGRPGTADGQCQAGPRGGEAG